MTRESCHHSEAKVKTSTEMCAFLTSKKEKKNLSERGKNCQKYMVLSTDIVKQVTVQVVL